MNIAKKKPLRALSIYLMKIGITDPAAALNSSGCRPAVPLSIEGAENCVLLIRRKDPSPPKWADLFEGPVAEALRRDLLAPSISGSLFLVVDGRAFVIVFGAGGRHLLQPDTWEERFGLVTALKSVDPQSLRCVDVQSLDALQSQSRIQSGQEASPEEFGLNVEQDLLKALVGAPLDPRLGNRMAGSDGLSVSVNALLSDVPTLLRAYLAKHEEPLIAGKHDWVTNIAPVKSAGQIAKLERELEAQLERGDTSGLWLAIPEIIDWSRVKGFVFAGDRAVLRPDVSLIGFGESLNGAPISLKLMKDRVVMAVDGEGENVGRAWKVYKCLYAEMDHGGEKHILNDGKWYLIATSFVAKTKADFDRIPRSTLPLPKYKGGGEGKYNEQARDLDPARFHLLDADTIMHGGGQGKIELCDLLSRDGELVHVKQYSKSSVLSHLFAQGYVSAQLLRTDDEFRGKAYTKVPAPFNSFFDPAVPLGREAMTVVYAIISEAPQPELRLPFFSQVNLNNTARALGGLGFKVQLLKISWDPSLTPTAAPKKTRKPRSPRTSA
ncbi:MAG: hypothetical protein GTN60_07240 [Pseudomonas stutzeri]|nr:hypothetical protein [Stutzerimonas stutzeri]NIM88794.1 hypothetical protein [Stutzerimonas stutzeri]NIN81209.1 hypothetical protein [Stutzerimonas stutzeri]NIP00456.1 hypothetical protein [Stutzerimonas stutzeri]NIQ23057.1 hypothetical protein [Stutzerimonas stutzeri]